MLGATVLTLLTVHCARPAVVNPSTSTNGAAPTTLVPAPGALAALLAAVDRDGDQRITVLDGDAMAGDALVFDLPLVGGGTYRVEGAYHLANLVQELALRGESSAPLSVARLVENPVDRLSRLIHERYWDALTRRIDAESLDRVLADDKVDGRRRPAKTLEGLLGDCTRSHDPELLPRFLYVPHDDPASFERYATLGRGRPNLIVCRLPERVTPEWVASLDGDEHRGTRHGLLALASGPEGPLPYVVPGGRFNELYGWDSYFHVLGLVEDGRLELARAVVDNLAYEVRHYGQVLNANRTYYLTRSQPPFLSSMVRALRDRDRCPCRRDWVAAALDTVISEYHSVWTQGARRTALCRGELCLSRYHGAGLGEPPEVEPGHFDWLYAPRARALGLSLVEVARRYRARELPPAELAALDDAFTHDRCMRESGHDTTYRFRDPATGLDRCADFATVDLNSLLLKTELDVAHFLETEFGGELVRPGCTGDGCRETTTAWCDRARDRVALLRELAWDGERHLFFDVDVGTRRQSGVVSATAIYPLWAVGPNVCGVSLFSDPADAQRLVAALLTELEQPGGLSATARPSLPGAVPRQWEYPNGWAPHQVLAWQALRQYGLKPEADRLTFRWLAMIVENARDYHGTVPEKFDVVARCHRVFAEYGNVATDFAYITPEGFGWMNASYAVGLASLPPDLRERLRAAAAAGAAADADLPFAP